MIKAGIVKEVTTIQERNEARNYAMSRPKSESSFASDHAVDHISLSKSSHFGGKSQSPSKSQRCESPKATEVPSILKRKTDNLGTIESGQSAIKEKDSVNQLSTMNSVSPTKTTQFKIGVEPVPTSVAGLTEKNLKSIQPFGLKSSDKDKKEVVIDYNSWTVEELTVKIRKIQDEESKLMDEKNAVRKRSSGAKRKMLKELDDQLKEKRNFRIYLEAILDSKIPFYEKLPKNSMFYKHYIKIS